MTDIEVDWAELLLADLADDGESLMSQNHVIAVSDLTLRAQEQAARWGTPREPGP